MRAITGAIVLLAAAVVFAGDSIAEALMTATKPDVSIPGRVSMIGGAILGLVGLVMLGGTAAWPPHESPRRE